MIRRSLALAAPVAALPVAAFAHAGGGGGGLAAGLAHPVGGADHLLAMVAVGLWAAQAGGRAAWAAPGAFLLALVAGAGLALAGFPVPAVEPLILASVVVLGAAVALALRPSLLAVLPAVVLFGLAHGAAHGLEAPSAGLSGYGLGFVLASGALHATGFALGRWVAGAAALQGLGGATAAAGLALVVAG